MTRSLDRFKAGVRKRRDKFALARYGNHHVTRAAEHQRGDIELPELMGDIKTFERLKAACHAPLIRLPAALNDEIRDLGRLGNSAMQDVEELIKEGLIGGEGNPFENSLQELIA